MTTTQTVQVLQLRGDLPKVDHKRMNETLHYSCQWGCTPDGGMDRLTLNDDDAKVRRWFIQEVESLGCKVTIDAMGNIFAVKPGKIDGPPIAMGSHLDTQPTGGRYDGILGVLSGLEVLKTLKDNDITTKNPLAVICWTNEEGSRFVPSMLGSAVWAHHETLDFGLSRTDPQGITLKSELERHGFLGTTPSSFQSIPLKAHFEVHIEQGPILDSNDSPVATVSGVQASRWFEVKVQGRGSHAGTTPMRLRVDPLNVVAQFILKVREIALQYGGLATVGRLHSDAVQSTNVIFDNVVFHIDSRHHEDAKLDAMEQALKSTLDSLCGDGISVTRFDQIVNNPAVVFDPIAVSCVRNACSKYPQHTIVSGAGHDSVHTAKHCPTAMIFVRCKDGISHHPSEFSTAEDCTAGAQVLLESVLSYDHLN